MLRYFDSLYTFQEMSVKNLVHKDRRKKTVDIVCSYLVLKVLKRIQTMSNRPLFHKVDTKRGKFSIKLLGIPLYMLQKPQ